MRQETCAVGETVERLREVGLEHRPRNDVDVSFEERLERRGPCGKEMDLEPPELRRPENVVLESGERDAARKPCRDGKRSRVYGLSGVCGSLRRGRLRESVTRQHPGREGVVVPPFAIPVEGGDVAGREDPDAHEAVPTPRD